MTAGQASMTAGPTGWLDRFWFPPMPARRLATLRILLGGYAFFYVLGRLPALLGLLRYPAGQFEPVGPVSMLSSPLPAPVVILVLLLTVGLGAAFVLGWRLAIVGPVYAVLLIWLLSYRNSWGMVFHTENLLVLHVAVLAMSRCGDDLSLDARRRGASKAPTSTEHGRYGWPVRLLCAVTVVTYFLAGYAKLRHAGFDWITSDTLLNFVAYDNVRKAELGAGYSVLGGWAAGYPRAFPVLATFSIVVELGAPLALAGPRIGRAWAAAAWSFHLGVLLLMFILFHYQLFGFAYASFFPVERLAAPLQRRLERRLNRRRGPIN